MTHGPDGRCVFQIDWEDFTKWQNWDQFPERADNPPLSADMDFWYKGRHYTLAGVNHGVAIFDYNTYEQIIFNKNFLKLVLMPFVDGKSFKELLPEMLFSD